LFKIPVPRLPFAVDRARTPHAAERTGDTLAIQVLGDLLRRDAGNELAEDPLNDRRLGRIDFAFARPHATAVERLDDSIPVAQAAGGLAVLNPSTESMARLLRQVLQE
jgi:hypothetical protein